MSSGNKVQSLREAFDVSSSGLSAFLSLSFFFFLLSAPAV